MITCEAAFHSKKEVNLESTDADELYAEMKDRVIEDLTNFLQGGSGWRFRSIVSLNVFTVEYKPLKGSSYIPLPKNFKNKKAIINMENEDDQCFKWSVTRALNPKDKNSEKVDDDLIEQAKELNWKGINFPLAGKISTNLKRITQLFL